MKRKRSFGGASRRDVMRALFMRSHSRSKRSTPRGSAMVVQSEQMLHERDDLFARLGIVSVPDVPIAAIA